MSDIIEVEDRALTTLAEGEVPPEASPTEQRTLSVARCLDAAYQRASTLELSSEEIARLRADFSDEDVKAGAGGKADLLYIEHASIRERLFDVFGPGKWSLVPRRMWSEEYSTKSGPAVRVYVDCVLVVKGCYVGESTGAMSYFPSNASQNYGDAVEGAQSEALRRVAAKSLGVGLHVWKKGWCEAWYARRGGKKYHPQTPTEVNTGLKAQAMPLLQKAAEQGAEELRQAVELLSPPMLKAVWDDLKGLALPMLKSAAGRGEIGLKHVWECFAAVQSKKSWLQIACKDDMASLKEQAKKGAI